MIEELLTVQVRKRQLQGDGVVVLDLIPVGGAKLPAFEAGAHVDIHIVDMKRECLPASEGVNA